MGGGLFPTTACLQNEDHGGDVAAPGSFKEIAGDRCDCFGRTPVEFPPKMLTQRLGRALDDSGDIVMRYAEPGEISDLLSQSFGHGEGRPGHRPALLRVRACEPKGGSRLERLAAGLVDGV